VVVPAGVAEWSVGVAVRVGAGGATAPCCEDATVGVGCAAWEDSGGAEVAGCEAEAEGVGVVAAAVGEGEEEACVGVGDGELCGPCPCPVTPAIAR
jgi:hypothetical protein